jgi:nucleotide-binding universal stress UspA family protein
MGENPMIKDVMVRLDGTAADDIRLSAAEALAGQFDGLIVGLFLNVLPTIVADIEFGTLTVPELIREARESGDGLETILAARLRQVDYRSELRRFDVFIEDLANVAVREARSADTFVALRPNGSSASLQEPEDLVESVLFGAGRHLFLVPEREPERPTLNHVLIAWNGSRESTRALAEAMPYLHKARSVAVIVAGERVPGGLQEMISNELEAHLKHHGIEAEFRHIKSRNGDDGAAILAEAKRSKADILVMGGYGHSRLREWLLGGVTYELMRGSPIPIVIAH